jgi:hypothetical protein
MSSQGQQGCRNAFTGTQIATHHIERDGDHEKKRSTWEPAALTVQQWTLA